MNFQSANEMDKKNILKLIVPIVIAFAFFIILISAGSLNDWTISGNNVYINNSNVFINANPANIYSSGWVYFNLTSKSYTGDIDAVFGFNTSLIKPSAIQLYNPQNITTNQTNSYFFKNVTSATTTASPCQIGNSYNSLHYNITYGLISSNSTNQTRNSIVACFDSYSPTPFTSGGNYTIYWNTTSTHEEDWQSIPDLFSAPINFIYGNMTQWYPAMNVPITANKNYYFRVYMDMFKQTEFNGGKYWFAVKPSSETLAQAISNGHLYALDPWWYSWQNWNDDFEIPGVINSTLWNNFTATCTYGWNCGLTPGACVASIGQSNIPVDGNANLSTSAGSGSGELSGASAFLLTQQDYNDSLGYNITFTLNTTQDTPDQGQYCTASGVTQEKIVIANSSSTYSNSCSSPGVDLSQSQLLYSLGGNTARQDYLITIVGNNFSIYNKTSNSLLNSTTVNYQHWYIGFVNTAWTDNSGNNLCNSLRLYNYTSITSDACLYSGSGNWLIQSSDYCNITSNVNLQKNNITINGSGITMITANITNFTKVTLIGINSTSISHVICKNGGCFK